MKYLSAKKRTWISNELLSPAKLTMRQFLQSSIQPKPKKVIDRPDLIRLADIKVNISCGILIGEKATLPEQTAAQELQNWMTNGNSSQKPALITTKDQLPFDVNIVIGQRETTGAIKRLLGRTRADYNISKNKEEGYLIRFLKKNGKEVVVCCGNDASGSYWAVQSLKQLFGFGEKEILLRKADIIDWPTIRVRGINCYDMEDVNLFSFYKYSSCDLGVFCNVHWRKPPEDQKKLLERLCQATRSRGINPTLFVNPLIGKKITISNKKDIEALYNTSKMSLQNGSRLIMLCLDDFSSTLGISGPASYYVLTDPQDRKVFKGDLAEAHVYLANKLYRLIKKEYPDAVMLLCPAYYFIFHGFRVRGSECWNECKEYLITMGRKLIKDIPIVWTGMAMRAPLIKRTDVEFFGELVNRKKLFLWDNSPYALHDPPYYLFDRYAEDFFGKLPEYLDSGIHSNGGYRGREISKVEVIQNADYFWNPAGYNPEESLRSAIARVAGADLVDQMQKFRDLYSLIFDRNPIIQNEQAQRPVNEDIYKELCQQKDNLEKVTESIVRKCRNKKLAAEIKDLYSKIEKGFSRYDGHDLVRKDLTKIVGDWLILPAESFYGGLWEPASIKNGAKSITMIFGKRKAGGVVSSMSASFYLRKPLKHDTILSIEAVDSDKFYDPPTKIKITLNHKVIFAGPNEFLKNAWTVRSFSLDKHILKKGKNVLAIENLEDTNDTWRYQFFLAEAKILIA